MRRDRGFTLIEMLVVTAMLAVLATAVVLTAAPDPRAEAAREGERLRLLLQVAIEESRWSGAMLAWTPTAEGYRFDRSDAGRGMPGWQPVADDDRLRARRLPDGLKIVAVELEGRKLAADAPLPFVAGIAPLFAITLHGNQATLRLESQADGSVAVVDGGRS